MTRRTIVLLALSLAAVALHVATNNRYGFFRDELYFIDCGVHLDWGYVDHAPMIGLAARVTHILFGDSLRALHTLPAIASGVLALLTGLIAIEIGGGVFALLLGITGITLAPVMLAGHTLLTMNAFEPLFWMAIIYVVLLAINRDNPRLLLWVGVCAGLGLENKHSTIFFLFAAAVGLLSTRDRPLLWSKWMLLATAIAFALCLPNLIWQYQHHFPTLEDLTNVKKQHKNLDVGPLGFFAQQIMIMNPLAAPVWLAGFIWLFRTRYRFVAFTYLAIFLVFLLLHGKNYYLAPAYGMLFAAGGVFWERFRYSRYAVLAVVLLSGALLAPFGLPLLSPENLVRYQATLHAEPPKTEVAHNGPLPQQFGDQFGWPEMVAKVADVYWRLSPEDRAKTAIITGNYGEAGAIDFFGPKYGLPKVISGHQTYWLWGPRDNTAEVAIFLQYSEEDARRRYNIVEVGPEVFHPWAMSEEHFHIMVGRSPKASIQAMWPGMKHWN